MTGQRPRSLTPHLFVRDADGAVAFYQRAFGAAELLPARLPDGRVLFVELAVGGGRLLLSEQTPALNALAPPTIGERYGVVRDPFGHRWRCRPPVRSSPPTTSPAAHHQTSNLFE